MKQIECIKQIGGRETNYCKRVLSISKSNQNESKKVEVKVNLYLDFVQYCDYDFPLILFITNSSLFFCFWLIQCENDNVHHSNDN